MTKNLVNSWNISNEETKYSQTICSRKMYGAQENAFKKQRNIPFKHYSLIHIWTRKVNALKRAFFLDAFIVCSVTLMHEFKTPS